jgi:hypothetical protein
MGMSELLTGPFDFTISIDDNGFSHLVRQYCADGQYVEAIELTQLTASLQRAEGEVGLLAERYEALHRAASRVMNPGAASTAYIKLEDELKKRPATPGEQNDT